MTNYGRVQLMAAAVLLAAAVAQAQNLPQPGPGEGSRCGVHYYGPCLPEEPAASREAAAPADDYSARTAFDEFTFAGDDPLTTAIVAAEAGIQSAGARAEAKTVSDPAYTGKASAKAAPVALASARAYQAVDESEEEDGGYAEPPPGWRYAPQGTRLDPVETVQQGERIVRGIVGRKTGTSQLNFVSIHSPGAAGMRGPEDAMNWMGSVWDGTQQQVLAMDLETHAKEHNFVRERGPKD